ncbi:hypothetical protein VJW24_11805, partial [Escherichia coli]|nr:hypothetical protein [Escherichia coli]
FGGKTSIFSHPVYLFLRKFSLQDSRGGSLCSRYRSLTAKEKKSQVAITAVARELTGFMWDIALAAQSSFSQQKQN